MIFGSLNTQTLQRKWKVPELVSSAEKTRHDVLCIQEHRFVHPNIDIKEHNFGKWILITCSAWKNSMNAATGGIGILLNSRAYDKITSVEKINPRIMAIHFEGNPMTTVISSYSPTNVTDEQEVELFYTDLTAFTRNIPKHNVLIIGGDFNAHLGYDDGHKYSLHRETNRNGNMLQSYLQENNLLCLNTHFQKRLGQKWTHTSPNGFKSQIDFLIINKKWKNSAKNCRAFNSFISVASDHRIISAKICLCLRANKKKLCQNKPFNWSTLKDDSDVRKSFITEVKNGYTVLQESEQNESTANSRYNNFEKACKEAATKEIPLKPKMIKRLPWETPYICQKREILHQAAEIKNSDPTSENIKKFTDAQNVLTKMYENEQTEYVTRKIDVIKNAISFKKSALAWKTVNEVSGRKNTEKAKIKANSEKERIQLWHQHFKELLGKPIQTTTNSGNECIVNTNKHLNIETGPFTAPELSKATKSIQNGKAVGLDEIPAEVWKIDDFQEFLLESCNCVYNQESIRRWREGCILPFPKKGNLSITKNYRGITLTPIAAKIYNLMLLNRIRPVIDPILRKNQNGFRTNRSTSGQILTIRRILEGVKAKKLPITLLFIDFAKAFDSIGRLKMENILIIYGIPKDIVNAIMMLYRNTSAMVRSPDGDTPYFEITTGVLQGDTLAPYLFIICLDYILKHSIDDNINLGFTLSQRRSSRHPAIHITDIDYADDIAVTADTIKDAEKMLHQIEEAAEDIGLKINSDKTEYMSLNSKSDNMISRNGNSIKNVDNFKYLGSYIANTENDINTRIAKAWAALNSMIILWKSNLSENLKRSFFRAAVESVLVYGATTWTLTATLEKRLDGAYTRMLRAALNKSWKDRISNKDLYLEIPRISASIRKQRLRFAGHCWRSKDELASDVLLWQPTHSKRPRGRPAKTYIDQLLEDTGCNIDEIPTAMNDRKGWMERVKKCRASSTW